MMQEYTLKRPKQFRAANKNFQGFYDFLMKSGVGNAFFLESSVEEFAKLVYKNVPSSQIALRTDKDGFYTLYAGRVLLLKIRDNRIIKVCVPGVKSLKNNYMFCGHDFEYTLWAKFPDLEDGGDYFLDRAYDLQHLSIPNVKKLGNGPLAYSQLPQFNGPELESAGDYFLYKNEYMYLFNAPKLRTVGRGTLYNNNVLDCTNQEEMEEYDGEGLLKTPNLKKAGVNCHPTIYDAIKQNIEKQR